MHLLLVEDSPMDVRLVREAIGPLIAQGTLQFSTVEDGVEALAFLRHHEPYTDVASPDLVLLDLNLPRKSGYEVLAELQQDLERKEALRKRLYELGPGAQESSIFWLADRTHLELEHPEQLLYGEVWTTPAGEQGSMFARHPTTGIQGE
jgi:CheY-like chemotaxis protein